MQVAAITVLVASGLHPLWIQNFIFTIQSFDSKVEHLANYEKVHDVDRLRNETTPSFS